MKNQVDFVSIIMPAYNAEEFISQSITSVINQSYKHWELIIVNDGSHDNTELVVKKFHDDRIRYYKKTNGGVSTARNLALGKMKGDYFCFIDADDELTTNSIEDRLKLFINNPNLSFVDGEVISVNNKNKRIIATFKPQFYGNPLKELALLNESCFFGITWMIKRDKKTKYLFRESFTHAEDIIFYIDNCSDSSIYAYVSKPIYIRNIRSGSAMTNLKSLENGYKKFYALIKEMNILCPGELNKLRGKIRMILSKSYVKNYKFKSAIGIILDKF